MKVSRSRWLVWVAGAALVGCSSNVADLRSASTSTAAPGNLALSSAIEPTSSVGLGDGRTINHYSDGAVEVLRPSGSQAQVSWCGDRYDAKVAFLQEVQRLIRLDDRTGLASTMSFPLIAPSAVTDTTRFLAHYDSLITPDFVNRVLADDPRATFCNSEGFMIADGAIWASDYDAVGVFRIITVNSPW